MTFLALLTVLGNLPLFAAVAGHVRAHRICRELDEIEHLTGGLGSWHDPTPPTPLRALDWPARQTPSDVAGAYYPHKAPQAQWPWRTGDVPAPDWDEILREARAYNWAVAQFNRIVAVSNEYDELVVAA